MPILITGRRSSSSVTRFKTPRALGGDGNDDVGTDLDGQRKEPAMRTGERQRWCKIGLLGVGLLVLVGTGAADEPQKADVKTPLQRLLQGDDVKKARDLQKRVDDLAEADKYADALAAAK